MKLQQGLLYRPMQAADIPTLQLWLPDVLPGDWTLASLEALLASTHQCRVLEEEGGQGESRLLGFAEFQCILDECHLHGIAVVTARQGAGLGRQLLQAVLEEAGSLGCRVCLLEARPSNTAAIGLYAGQGFKLTGMRKGYYPARGPKQTMEDALLYTLNLP
jgi:[ribosomal protein S18]-alanine N-acetyltransferase